MLSVVKMSFFGLTARQIISRQSCHVKGAAEQELEQTRRELSEATACVGLLLSPRCSINRSVSVEYCEAT